MPHQCTQRAAADGALRLHETSAARQWLAEAPASHRGWEWRYLQAMADQSLLERQAHDAPITGLAVSADNRWLATTSGDKSVRLWNATTGEPGATLAGHTATSWSPAFPPRSRELATLGSDGTVRVWDLEQQKEVHRFDKVGHGMGAVGWSPDGTLLAAGTWTVEQGRGVVGWLHMWNMDPPLPSNSAQQPNARLRAVGGLAQRINEALHCQRTEFAAAQPAPCGLAPRLARLKPLPSILTQS